MQKKIIIAMTGLSVLFAGAASAEQQRPKMAPAAMMQHLDANKDGKISKKEFMQGAKQREAKKGDRAKGKQEGGKRQNMNPEKMFARLDQNKDGVVTKGELEHMAEAHKKPRK